MRIVKFIAVLLLILGVIAVVLYLYADRIAVAVLEKNYGITIKYAKCSKNLLSCEFTFTDLLVTSKETGMGILSKTAKIKLLPKDRTALINFALTDGNFLKKPEAVPAHYDTLTALVAAPFDSGWQYRSISGQVEPSEKGMKLNDFMATSDEIKLSLNGELFSTGTIEAKAMIYFGAAITDKIPPEFAAMILTDEKDGWKSLSVTLTGDPNKPAVQLKSKSFRLSIKAVSGV
ncbi:MAG: hypothetical protein PHI58_06380 [Candidatus Omnitrophica bacterium]|nr:hypothetical protein [Candidatus Omnitrophota bacterium]